MHKGNTTDDYCHFLTYRCGMNDGTLWDMYCAVYCTVWQEQETFWLSFIVWFHLNVCIGAYILGILAEKGSNPRMLVFLSKCLPLWHQLWCGAKIRACANRPRRIGCTETICTRVVLQQKFLALHLWSSLRGPLESVSALARFYSGVLETGQAPRLQMGSVELLWIKLFFLLSKDLEQLHVWQSGWQSIVQYHPHTIVLVTIVYEIELW